MSNKPHSFSKPKRIASGQTFTLVMRRGGCAADDCLVVFAKSNGCQTGTEIPPSRLGVTIPKKTGNAVVRNRWKRWIRESFRTQQSLMPAGYDFIVRPKKDAVGSWSRIQRSLPKLARKAVQRIKR
ncbi:ribonuclease P protein component [Stieleria sp. TO1_6]|uniref:ribonuclease P protein component n=1 Tax=Stieleria tagensis TaxID=2956795 RepID=UPI00209B33A1|nr:ribonuclease P protein component [Stieleria tagensis]MCO8121447.1 ribonuclease P protein component [Stieleria tagensis]